MIPKCCETKRSPSGKDFARLIEGKKNSTKSM